MSPRRSAIPIIPATSRLTPTRWTSAEPAGPGRRRRCPDHPADKPTATTTGRLASCARPGSRPLACASRRTCVGRRRSPARTSSPGFFRYTLSGDHSVVVARVHQLEEAAVAGGHAQELHPAGGEHLEPFVPAGLRQLLLAPAAAPPLHEVDPQNALAGSLHEGGDAPARLRPAADLGVVPRTLCTRHEPFLPSWNPRRLTRAGRPAGQVLF